MQQIINYIRVNDLIEPIKSLVQEREQSPDCPKYSIYRDILFLACKVLGRSQIDINAFDKEYTNSHTRYTDWLLFLNCHLIDLFQVLRKGHPGNRRQTDQPQRVALQTVFSSFTAALKVYIRFIISFLDFLGSNIS